MSEDEQLQQALAASKAEADEAAEEERQFQEALKLSMQSSHPKPPSETVNSAVSSAAPSEPLPRHSRPLTAQEQLRERAERLKRKAGEAFGAEQPSEHSPVPATQHEALGKRKSTPDQLSDRTAPPAQSTSATKDMPYATGALRITRTPGRMRALNTISLPDLIDKTNLVSACVFAFFIAQDELFQHLPLGKQSRPCPVYVGRDSGYDPLKSEALREAGIPNVKLTAKQVEQVQPILGKLYKRMYGKNFNAFYAHASGSCHSKLMLLVYPSFLRIVITSCNFMDFDTVLGDNHWYIHDLPKRPSRPLLPIEGFEADLLTHLEALNTPKAFVNSIRGAYDFSAVKVALVTSEPGTFSGQKAERCGMLRLRSAVKSLNLKLPRQESEGKLELEICTASLGKLNLCWLDGFTDCALGRKQLAVAVDENEVELARTRIVYPTVQDKNRCYAESQLGASNIGCHLRPWEEAPETVKRLFHHYRSRDDGRLFHMKLICAHDPTDQLPHPYYVYVGSANLSAGAWGTLDEDKRGNKATSGTKVTKISNLECGIVIPGSILHELLAPATKDWKEVVFPYQRPAEPYNIGEDKPWNDPRWAKGYDHSKEASLWNA